MTNLDAGLSGQFLIGGKLAVNRLRRDAHRRPLHLVRSGRPAHSAARARVQVALSDDKIEALNTTWSASGPAPAFLNL
jgi:hypothetical protein